MKEIFKNQNNLDREIHEPVTVGSVTKVLRKWTVEPWANDLGVQAFSKAAINLLPTNIDALTIEDLEYVESLPHAEFIKLYLEAIHLYTSDSFAQDVNVTSPYIGHMMFRSFMHTRIIMQDELVMDALYEDDERVDTPPGRRKFPEDYTSNEAWEELILFNMQDAHFHMITEWNLNQRRIGTTHPNRYAGFWLGLKHAGVNLDHAIRIADLATGWGAGIKSILKGDGLQHIKVMKAVPADAPNAFKSELVYDEEATLELNKALAQAIESNEVGESIGVDLMGAKDKASELWGVASYILREQMDEEFMTRIYSLVDYKDQRLEFVTPLDLTDKTAFDEWMKQYEKDNGRPASYDAVLTFTMRHQLKTERERRVLRRNQNKITALGGIVIDQDFSHPSEWRPWGYKTTIRYPHRKARSEIVAVWKDDRCTEVILGGEATKIPDISDIEK